MPIKRIQFPDGSIKRVEVPDGATDDQILAFVQSSYKPQAQEKPIDPTEGMSTFDKVAAGVGKSMVDTWRGVKQLTGNMSREEVDEARALDAPLMNTGAGTAGYIGGTVGQVLLPGGALKAASRVPKLAGQARGLGVASRAFLPNSIKGGVAQGAALGGSQAVGTGDSRMYNTLTAGALSGAGMAIPRVAGAAYRGVRNSALAPTTNGATREAARTIRSMVNDPDALMTPAPSKIPGVKRTLFEETLSEPIARMETRSRGRAEGWKDFDGANDAARQSALRTFAGDEASLDDAIKARSKATSPLYAKADRVEGVDTTRLLSQIKRVENKQRGRDSVQSGLAHIREKLTREVPEQERKRNALSAFQKFVTSGRKSGSDFDIAKEAMTAIRRGEVPAGQFTSQAGQDALKAARKALKVTQTGVDDMQTISNVRLTIGDMLSGKFGGDSGPAMAGSRSLMAVKGQLDRVAAKASPEFAQATQTFRDMSAPINRMQAGQRLLETATSKNLDPTSKLYPLISGQYGGKVKALDKLVQEATGFRKAQASNVFRPEDMATIGNVQDDLSRSAARLSYGNGGGSHTVSQGELGMTMARKALARVVPGLNNAVEFLDNAARQRVDEALTEMLRNPDEFRRVAALLPTNERALVEQVFARLGQVGGANAIPLLSE